MSDNIKKDNQQIELSDTELAKIAAALLGVEYPGDEYFDGTKETDSISTVKVVSVESESVVPEEVSQPEESEEELSEVNYAEKVRSTPFRKQSFSAWQSARLRNFAKAGIITTAISEEEVEQEEITLEESAVVVDNDSDIQNNEDTLEEGVITISDILGEDASVMAHEPDLLAIEDDEMQEETISETGKIDLEQEEIVDGEIDIQSEEISEIELEEDDTLLEEIESVEDEIQSSEEQELEDEVIEDDGEQIERLKGAMPVIPIVAYDVVETEKEELSTSESVEEIFAEEVLVAEEKAKPKRKERIPVEIIREITVCEKKNQVKTTPPTMPEFKQEQPMYFAYIEAKPKKIRRTSNAPHIIPTNSESLEFSPKGGAYREI